MFTFLFVGQDYLWFVSLILWAGAGACYWRCRNRFADGSHRWIPGTALMMIGMAVTEWWMFATPVTSDIDAPPHRIGDFVLGCLLALQPTGWLIRSGARRAFVVPAALLLMGMPLWRWDYREFGGVVLPLATLALVPLVWRSARSNSEKTGLAIATLSGWSLAVDGLFGQARLWMEVSQIAAVVALASILAGSLAIRALGRSIRATWLRETRERRAQEVARFAKSGTLWLVGGFALAILAGASARRLYENSILVRARIAAATLDLDALADLLGPHMKLERRHEWRRPSGRATVYAHVPHHASDASLGIRDSLRLFQDRDPGIILAWIATIRSDFVVMCLAPHSPGLRPADDPDHFSYVTLQRPVTARDTLDWGERRERFDIQLNTSYNEIGSVRVPLVHPQQGMLGWLELNMPVSFWVAPQAVAHLQTILAVFLGLGVLGALGLQRWRNYEREQAMRQAEVDRESNVLKNVFMAKVSHELKSPLQGILGYGQMLHDTVLETDQRRYVEGMLNQGVLLNRLVGDLLDLGAIETGTLRLRQNPVRWLDTVEKAIESMRPRAESKGLLLTLRSPHMPERWVWADSERIQQVVVNLVSNAVKFTDTGRIEVRASGAIVAGAAEFRLDVIDTGPGISAADQATLFRPFTRLAATADREGAGLGLAIAQELCRRMKGDITVASTGVLGSTFSAVMRLKVAEPAPAAEFDSEAAVILAGQRILIADDNQFIRELFAEYLTGLGARCDVVADGVEAVRKAAATPFDAIILDMLMPGMTGGEAAQAIKRQGASSRARLIMASASHEAAKLPPNLIETHLPKPVDLMQLGRVLARNGSPSVTPSEALASLMAKFRAGFHDDARGVVSALQKALELQQWNEMRRLAHETKNSADIIGARAIALELGRLEEAIAVSDTHEARRVCLRVCVQFEQLAGQPYSHNNLGLS